MKYRCVLCGISVGGKGMEKHYDSQRCKDIKEGVKRGFRSGRSAGLRQGHEAMRRLVEGEMFIDA